MISEVVVATSSNDNFIYIWDIRSGTLLTTFKGNKTDTHALALLSPLYQPARKSYIYSAQNDRPQINVWSFRKDQLLYKFTVPEKLSSIITTNNNNYFIGGSETGKIYVWEVTTGKLIKIIDAHYKAINVMKITSDDIALITGSEDSIVKVWLLNDLINNQPTRNTISPYYTWTEHTLPITDLVCGLGLMNYSRVVTVSLDRSCKIWDLSDGKCLATVIVPTNIRAVTMNPTETSIYVGGGDGLIYCIDLYSKAKNNQYGSKVDLNINPEGVIDFSINNKDSKIFKGHTQAINSLSCSFDGSLLVSASDDEKVIIWDAESQQQLKSFAHYKGKITNVEVILRPIDLLDNQSKYSLPIIKPLKRYVENEMEGMNNETETQYIGYSNELEELENKYKTSYDNILEDMANRNDKMLGAKKASENEIERLQNRITELERHSSQLRIINESLYNYSVNNFLNSQS